MDIQELAAQTADQFKRLTRDDGSDYLNRPTWDYAEDWIQDMRQSVHNDPWMLDALNLIADNGDETTIEADPYYSDLLTWLRDGQDAQCDVDDAVENGGYTNFFDTVANGQIIARQRIYATVLDALQTHLDELDTAA